MKKIFLLAAALLLTGLAPATASAQSEPNDTVKKVRQMNRQRPGGRQIDPEKMLTERVKHMTERYQLTEEQQKAIATLLKEQSKNRPDSQRRKMRELSQEEREKAFKEMKERREKFEAAMQKILTEEQFKKYQQDVQERMKKMQHRRRGPGQRPEGKGPQNANND